VTNKQARLKRDRAGLLLQVFGELCQRRGKSGGVIVCGDAVEDVVCPDVHTRSGCRACQLRGSMNGATVERRAVAGR
jgi:hypothetical protein